MTNKLIENLTKKVERLERENWRLRVELRKAEEVILELEVLAELPDGGK
jgi:hypothetical protein